MSDDWANFYNKELNLTDYVGNIYQHLPLFEEIIGENPAKILEVGIGNGSMSIFLSQLGYEATGIDNDIKIVEKAIIYNQHYNGHVKFIYHDAFTLERLGDAFDVVFSQGFFEHFSNEEIRSLIKKQLEVGEKVLFNVPSNFYPGLDLGNERLLSRGEWYQILEGLNVTSIEYYGNYHIPIKYLIKNIFKFPQGYSITPLTLFKRPYHLLIRIER
jgi:SAM-dependent methyltransferase